MQNLMKPTWIPGLLLGLFVPGAALAQRDVPLRSAKEREVFQTQTAEFNEAIKPILQTAARSTVRVFGSTDVRLAYGTVVGNGDRILTKWSEIRDESGPLTLSAADNTARHATLAGVYEDEDVAVLALQGDPLPPVQWHLEAPELGQFLAAPQPDGVLAGFGVVSVLERNLRDTDYAFLGVTGNPRFEGPGVLVESVAPTSGAEAAGIRAGDVILKAGDREISGMLELRSALIGVHPGDTIEIGVRRGDEERKFNVLLGNRPQSAAQAPGGRLRQMERMGSELSRVATDFSRVIQTDMRLLPNQAGGPVVDLEGRVVGITLARTDRTRSFVMPAAVVLELLATEATEPGLVEAAKPAMERPLRMAAMEPGAEGAPFGPPQAPADPERLRRHLSDIQRLRDLLREEMEALGDGS
jgi:S1-C subfamily serine protease